MVKKMNDIEERVLGVIGKSFSVDPSELDLGMIAEDIDGWDSLSHVTLILMLSKEFGVHISAEDAEDLENIGALVDLIKKKV